MKHLFTNYTRLRRRWIVFWCTILSPARSDRRVKRPKMTPSEAQAARIWSQVVHQVDSDLLYNPQTHDAYALWEAPSGTVYLFLESGNLRVINTVVGYDIRLSGAVEHWCSAVFTREVAKRRNRFRLNAESKVVHSLDSLESRLKLIDAQMVQETHLQLNNN